MGIFSNAFRSIKSSIVPAFKQKINCLPGATILESINRYKDYLQTNAGVGDSLISALTMSSDMMVERITADSFTITNTVLDFAEVPETLCDILVEGFSDLCHSGKDEVSRIGVTVTDSAGHAYNIVDQRSEELFIDGKHVLFSMTYAVSSVQEAIIYQDQQGKLYINNCIKTADFVKSEGGSYVEPTNIFELLQSANIISGRFNPSNSIMAQLQTCLGHSCATINAGSTELGEGNNILTRCQNYWRTVAEEHELTPGGYVNSIWNVLNDLVESASLNTVIASTCDAILGGLNSGVAVSAIVDECLLSKFKSVRSFGSGVATSFNRGGVYGLGCYILSFLKELCEASAEDGTLHFTDNDRLCPKIYIAGVIQAIATSISAVLSMIVSIFKPIVGAAFMILGSVATSFFSAINYDYSSANSALNTSDKVILPISPYGVIQTELPCSRSSLGDEVYGLLVQGNGLLYAMIPGGYILIGPGSFNDDGTISTVRYELHPAICDCRRYFDVLSEYLLVEHKVGYVDDYSSGSHRLHFATNISTSERRVIANDILTNYDALTENLVIENEDNEHLSDQNDALLLKIIAENTFIAGLFLACVVDLNYLNHWDVNLSYAAINLDTNKWCPAINNAGNKLGFWYGLFGYCQLHELMCLDDDPIAGGVWTTDGVYDRTPTWLHFSQVSINRLVTDVPNKKALPILLGGSGTSINLGKQKFYDDVTTFTGTLEPAIFIPQYDKKSFWANVITTAVITTIVAATVAVTVYSARRAIAKRRAFNQAAVQSAHEAFVDNPTDANYAEYVQAVRKNNMWSSLIGGTKYDYVNYWNADPADNATAGSQTGSVVNLLSGDSLLGGSKEPVTNSDVVLTSANNQRANVNLDSVIRLIRI